MINTPITINRLKEIGFYKINEKINVWHFGEKESGIELTPYNCFGEVSDDNAEWIFTVELSCYSTNKGKNFKPFYINYKTIEDLEQLITTLRLKNIHEQTTL